MTENVMDDVNNFLCKVYDLCKKSDSDSALDETFDFFESHLWEESYEVCNSAIETVELSHLDTTTMIGWLAATFPRKDFIPARKILFTNIERFLISLNGKESTDMHLRGLE